MIHFDLATKRETVAELEAKTLEANFWDDVEAAQKVINKIKSEKSAIDTHDEIIEKIEDNEVLLDLLEEEEDDDEYENLQKALNEIEKEADTFRISTLLDGEYDGNNAILSIHAGAGGTEAQDWAGMLLRMYRRYADSKGYSVETLDLQTEEEAGIKSATILIKGENAYGYLKTEKGVHRLVRISPFDSAKKRHTSFSSVDVFPELDDDINIEIRDEDIKVDTYRASGAGGQHVNTTDSAVRITHIPTGVVVQNQTERSQIKNRDAAMKMLKAKLVILAEEEQKEKIEDLQGNYSQIAWGSQIRSYVFNPYSMVKDHRTNVEIGDVYRVMDGDLDPFINEYLQQNTK